MSTLHVLLRNPSLCILGKVEETRQHADAPETQLIANIIAGPSSEGPTPTASQPLVRKRKAPRAPNPLSVKRRKVEQPRNSTSKPAQKSQDGPKIKAAAVDSSKAKESSDNENRGGDETQRSRHKRKRRRKNGTDGKGVEEKGVGVGITESDLYSCLDLLFGE